MANLLRTADDFDEMLATGVSILFVSVNWSEYTRRGEELFRVAESQTHASTYKLSWWIVDISRAEDDITAFLKNWLSTQSISSQIIASMALGNGAVVWINRGTVIQYAPNAQLLGVEGLLRTTAMATT